MTTAAELLARSSGLSVDDDVLARHTKDRHTRLQHLADVMAQNSADNDPRHVVQRANWFISNACPMLCKGCYSPFVADRIGLPEALEIVATLADHGTSGLMISGGDPLMWPGIVEVVAAAADAGLEVGLDSTFHHPDSLDLLRAIAPHVTTVGVPLDGADEASIRQFRRGAVGEILPRVLSALTELDRLGLHGRAHTVVHRGNVASLDGIAALLAEHPSIRQWALYQYWGRRASSVLNRSMDITPEEFDSAVAGIRRAGDIEVLAYPAARRSMTNFMITASGLVVTTADGVAEEFILGNILTDPMSRLVSSPAVTQGRLITKLVGHGYSD